MQHLTAEKVKSERTAKVAPVNMKKIRGFGFSMKEFKDQLPNSFLAAAIGIGIGILPGIGAATSNIVAYTVCKEKSKRGELYGTGIIGKQMEGFN